MKNDAPGTFSPSWTLFFLLGSGSVSGLGLSVFSPSFVPHLSCSTAFRDAYLVSVIASDELKKRHD